MKMNKSTKYSALFFLIFILGLIFFVATIHKSLNKKTDIIIEADSTNQKSLVLTISE